MNLLRLTDGHVPAKDVRPVADLDWLGNLMVGTLLMSAAAFTFSVIALLLAASA